mmetsp:Transcript_6439/g.3656  ORF Transcript_6439/g.3656 Transcript_6439/m.3656 type:complete len:136 (+) Transcript_6439:205-612(+)
MQIEFRLRNNKMFTKLFLAFTLIPIVEIYVLINIGSFIGAVNTIILVILTGIIGAYLARVQGIITLMKVRTNLSQGIMPTEELIDSLMILVAGIVLITPGFITDIVGFLLLIPTIRGYLKKIIKQHFKVWMNSSL